MELFSMFCASLDGRRVWGRMDTCVWMAESLHCSPETTTTLIVCYILIQNKKFKVKKIVVDPSLANVSNETNTTTSTNTNKKKNKKETQEGESRFYMLTGIDKAYETCPIGKPPFDLDILNVLTKKQVSLIV